MPEGLRDIHGLDSVPWWPLAPGWWWLLGAVAVLAIIWLLSAGVLARMQRDWRKEARRLLSEIRRRLYMADERQLVREFSELVRRIAIARFGRESCAGLTGGAWLEWLRDHDPTGFDWVENGRVLIEAPYAPPGAGVDLDVLGRLIGAAQAWVQPPVGVGKA